MERIKDQQQEKPNGGEQKILLDPALTAETDELDPSFQRQNDPELSNSNSMQQFRIEVAIEGHGRFYDIMPLGNARYQISENGELIGSIQLDEKDHARCESQGCEFDLSALHAIREGIQFQQNWKGSLGQS